MTEKVRHPGHEVNQTSHKATAKVSAVMFFSAQPAKVSTQIDSNLKLFSTSYGFQRVHMLLFLLLSISLLGVLFLLPSMVTAPVVEDIPVEEEKVEIVKAPPDSPWSDAQLAKQRREAQEVLSQILNIQNKLEAKKVEAWAQTDFQHAMDTAAAGDVEYRQRNFKQAQANYRESLQLFENLIARVDGVYDQQIALGVKAISDAQPQQAIDSYQLALDLKPASIIAQQGLVRAQSQDQVIAHISSGKGLMKRKHFADAKQAFEQALTLDGESKPAKEQLALVKQAIIDQNFAQAMSTGFSSLNQQRFTQAIKAFTNASKIKPQAKDASEALIQAKNKYVQAQIADHFDQADNSEQAEKWQQANSHFRKILKLDSSVIKARVGEIRSGVRAKLNEDLIKTLDQPNRLAAQSVYNQGQKLYRDADSIKNPGPRLKGQLGQLSQLLIKIKQPVPVQLKSDNQTTVTLYKVGSLGSFTAKNMDLKPGKYTVVGTRNGYRDTRREFTLLPSSDITTIVIQCEEKIRL